MKFSDWIELNFSTSFKEIFWKDNLQSSGFRTIANSQNELSIFVFKDHRILRGRKWKFTI